MRTLSLVALATVAAAGAATTERLAAHVRYSTSLTWVGQIAPIVEKRCVTCHTAGGTAEPYDTYVQIRPWLRAVREELLEGRMPRWPAAAGVGEHANDPRMSMLERDLVIAWIDGGAPAASPPGFGLRVADEQVAAADAARIAARTGTAAPASPDAEHAWDLVVPMALRPGTGEWDGDIPQGARVTHSIAAWTVVESGSAAEVSVEVAGRDIGTWVPGSGALEAPVGTAWRIPAPARIRARVVDGSRPRGDPGHLTRDTRLRLAFRFAPDTVAQIERLELGVGSVRIEQAGDVVSVRPLSSTAGASLDVVAVGAQGGRDLLVWIPSNMVDMQPTYMRRRPVRLAAGSVIELRSDDPGARAALGLAR